MNKSNELVSVIIPAYNAEAGIEKAIQSVLEQTYSKIECIVIDDGSEDQTREIVDSLAEKDQRIIVCHSHNQGVSCARNKGLSLANGTYIAFLDSDDWMEPDMIEQLLHEMSNDAALVICGYWMHRHSDTVHFDLRELSGNTRAETFQELVIHYYMNAIWNKLYRKNLIDFKFDPSISLGEDLQFNLRYLEKNSHFRLVKKMLYHYTRNDNGSTLTDCMPANRLYIVKDNFQKALAIYTDWGGTDKKPLKDLCARQCIAVLAGLSQISGSCWTQRKQIIKDCFQDSFLWSCIEDYHPKEKTLKLAVFIIRQKPERCINLFHAILKTIKNILR